MDQRTVALLSSHDGLNISGGKPSVGIQFLTGDGVVPLNTDAFRNRHIQTLILVKEEIVDLDIKQFLLGIDPAVAAAHCGRDLPALSRRAEFVRTGDRTKAVLRQNRTVVLRQNIAFHSPPCNKRTILCNDQAKSPV